MVSLSRYINHDVRGATTGPRARPGMAERISNLGGWGVGLTSERLRRQPVGCSGEMLSQKILKS